MKILSFIGPSGTGKGTQASLFKNLGFDIISGGEILRSLYELKTKEGIELFEKYWSKGIWVPDDIILKLIFDSINFKQKRDLILDACPRTLNQAILLDKFLFLNNQKLEYVFEFKLSKEIILERIKNRKIKEKRKDDISLSVIEKRLLEYSKNIPEIESYYKERLVYIDASIDKSIIFDIIANKI